MGFGDTVMKEYAVDLNLLLIIFTITVVSVLGQLKFLVFFEIYI